MRTVPRRSSIALLAAVAAAVAAFAGPAAASADEGQIIVKYAAGADAHERSEARADADVVRDQALALPRTELVTPETGTSVRDAVADLERSADVDYAEPDLPRHALDLYPDEAHVDGTGALAANTPFSNLWAFANEGQNIGGYDGHLDADIDAPAAWDVTTGSPDVKVAVVDSGVDRTHPDLFANLVPGYDFAYGDSDPTDYDGHGTHVAGIIAARGNNGVGVTGVAWQTSLMPVQALDATGSGTTTGIVQAYDYAARSGARIVNASLGGDTFSQTEYDAIKRAGNVLFVVAAGNDHRSDDNPATASYPCAYDLPNIVCVAATNNWDQLSYFSNFGAATVDIAAPGEDIYSTVRCGQYDFMSGTSMATPEVSGAAALILAQDPSLTPGQIRARLMESVDPLPLTQDAQRIASGGRLNVATALGVPQLSETTPPPVSNTGAGDGNGNGDPAPARTMTVAEPRVNEPQPPAQTCPTAPVRSTTGSASTPAPAVPATPSSPAAPAPSTAPAPATPAPTTTAPRTTPAADRTAPAVRAALSGRGALRALLAGRLRVPATVSERASVRVELRVDARTAKKLRLTKRAATVRIASATATATRAGMKTVTLRVTGNAKRALARVKRVKATLTVTAADASGNRRTRSSTLTITR